MGPRRVSLVTGAARGIGLAVAEALAARGDQVIAADLLFSDPAIRSKTAARLQEETALFEVDIAEAESVAVLVDATLQRFNRIDCLVNTAGVNYPAPIQSIRQIDWARTIGVNLTGAFLLSQAAVRPMIEQGFGRIVHIASTAAHTAAACLAAYAASKHGLLGLVRGMACDLAPYGITVNAVCPGNTQTEMLTEVLRQRAEYQGRTLEHVVGDLVEKTPAGRIGRPDDVAAAVLFLTSNEAEYITGQALTVDGGRSLNLV